MGTLKRAGAPRSGSSGRPRFGLIVSLEVNQFTRCGGPDKNVQTDRAAEAVVFSTASDPRASISKVM